jgi:hypothetical protein
MNTQPVPARAADLVAALDVYRQARKTLLACLGLAESNPDRLAELSEHLVAALIGAAPATDRAQAVHDVVLDDSEKN